MDINNKRDVEERSMASVRDTGDHVIITIVIEQCLFGGNVLFPYCWKPSKPEINGIQCLLSRH